MGIQAEIACVLHTLTNAPIVAKAKLRSKVYLKAINHVLLWVADVTYVDFMPSKDRCLSLGQDLRTVALPALSDMRVLKFAV